MAGAISGEGFSWQAQHVVKLDCNQCFSAHYQERFICDADQSRDSFCVASAVLLKLEADFCCSAHCKLNDVS